MRSSAEEKGDHRPLSGDQPHALPAVDARAKDQSKAARVHFDWNDIADVVAKVDEELAETKEANGAGNR
jgi:uncharacterized protein YabN with tetrapyrrole methylase and pyrophosphatase domain